MDSLILLLVHGEANMLSTFGFGHPQNKAYGLLNLMISIALYAYSYGLDQIFENGIYFEGLVVVV